MKSSTVYKDLKFNADTLQLTYKGELVYQFKASSIGDEYAIEASVNGLSKSIKSYNSVKNMFKEVVNHTIKHDVNGLVIKLDSMHERESFPLTRELYIAHMIPNNLIVI